MSYYIMWCAGDYTLLEKIFGQTSNNKERMKLKAEVLAKANTPTDPSLVSAVKAGSRRREGRSAPPSPARWCFHYA